MELVVNRYTTTKGGIVYPAPPKGKQQIFTITPYRFEDVPKFLILLDKKGGHLLSVVKSWWSNGMSDGWTITYQHHEPIEMEILC